MKKLVLLFILLWMLPSFAQDVPASWTANLGLRKYALDDYPGADSLNANTDQIDAGWKEHEDTLAALKVDIYGVITYAGSLKDDIVYSADLNTELDTSLVKTTGADVIYGQIGFANGTTTVKNVIPYTNETYYLGLGVFRWLRTYSKYVHAERYYTLNSAEDDSVVLSYSGGTFNVDKPMSVDDLTISDNFVMDSAAAIQTLKLTPNSFAIAGVKDTSIVVDSLLTHLHLLLPGDVDEGINTIVLSGSSPGDILIVYHTDATDSVIFKDMDTDLGGNLQMEGDFYMYSGDNIAFMYIYDQPALTWYWMELWRKDNSD